MENSGMVWSTVGFAALGSLTTRTLPSALNPRKVER